MANTDQGSITDYKYAVVQYYPKDKNSGPRYIVISYGWIKTIDGKNFLFWPNRNWEYNVSAVKNGLIINYNAWIKAPIKAIAKYSNDWYDAVRTAITLFRFGIDATKMSKKALHDLLTEIHDCHHCAHEIDTCTSTIACENVIDEVFLSKTIIVSRSSPDQLIKDDSVVLLSPSLLSKEKFVPLSMGTRAVPPSGSDDDKLLLSPSLIFRKRRAVQAVSPISPSLLTSKIACKTSKRIRLMDSFNDIQ